MRRNRIGEVADTVVEIDRAMKAGFNWELGPFEMWDAAGFAETVEKMRARGQAIPQVVERMMSAGISSWYRNRGRGILRHRFGDISAGCGTARHHGVWQGPNVRTEWSRKIQAHP